MLLFSGCASATYDIKVHAVTAQATAPRKSFRLEHATITPAEQSLYTAASKAVRAALASKGMVEATGPSEPDLVIFYSCGLGAPAKHLGAHSEAIYQMIPGPMRTETIQVGTTSSGSPIYQTVTRQDPPTQVITGYRQVPYEIVLYKNTYACGPSSTSARSRRANASARGPSTQCRRVKIKTSPAPSRSSRPPA